MAQLAAAGAGVPRPPRGGREVAKPPSPRGLSGFDNLRGVADGGLGARREEVAAARASILAAGGRSAGRGGRLSRPV
ncbi:hypothetical protein [Pyrobaculum sp.]|uniref:hypothetical protein n=1 Tax=Pyrobaculum sp. TaxID=2004705 RepID=UPI00317A1074